MKKKEEREENGKRITRGKKKRQKRMEIKK